MGPRIPGDQCTAPEALVSALGPIDIIMGGPGAPQADIRKEVETCWGYYF